MMSVNNRFLVVFCWTEWFKVILIVFISFIENFRQNEMFLKIILIEIVKTCWQISGISIINTNTSTTTTHLHRFCRPCNDLLTRFALKLQCDISFCFPPESLQPLRLLVRRKRIEMEWNCQFASFERDRKTRQSPGFDHIAVSLRQSNCLRQIQ